MLSWLPASARDVLQMIQFLSAGMWHSVDDMFFRNRRSYVWDARLHDLLAGSYPHLDGRWAVITGANSGIGYQLAKLLAKCGVNVVLACRSESRGTEAQRALRDELSGNCGKIEYVNLDMGDLTSVMKFADAMAGRGVGLLVCNAGGMLMPWSLTPQGFETVFGTHVVGHALLSQLLVPELKRSNKGTARIVHVSSKTVEHGAFLEEFFRRPLKAPSLFNRFAHYSNVKATQTSCALALADELGSEDIAVHAVHPGCVQTDIVANSTLPFASVMNFLAQAIQISAVEGASYVLRACLKDDCAPSNGTGRYFHCGHPAIPGATVADAKVKATAWRVLQEALRNGGWLK